MKDLKQELEALLTSLNELKEAMNMLCDKIEDALKEAEVEPEEQKPTIRRIPFDIKKAKQGAKIVTRDGHDVRILCYDRHSDIYPIVAVVQNKDSREDEIISYTNDGKYFNNNGETGDDLFIKEECA